MPGLIIIDRARLPASLDDTDAEALAAVAYGTEAVADALVVEILTCRLGGLSSLGIVPPVPHDYAPTEGRATDLHSAAGTTRRQRIEAQFP